MFIKTAFNKKDASVMEAPLQFVLINILDSVLNFHLTFFESVVLEIVV